MRTSFMQRLATGTACAAAMLATTAQAQRYERTLGSPNDAERAFDTEAYRDGSVSVGEYADPAGGFRGAHVVRYDALGLPIWNFVYDLPGEDVAFSVDIAPNGDILVAGWSSFATGGVQTLVMRLDPAGGIVWVNAYTGTAGLFPLHNDEHGPQLVVNRETGQIFVISNFQGLASAFSITPAGALIWSNLYDDAFSKRQARFAFTDIKIGRQDDLVISGTAELLDFTGELPFPTVQDPMLVRLDAMTGAVITSAHYNLSTGQDADDRELGEGLDVNRADGSVVLAGETLPGPTAGLPRQLALLADPGLGPITALSFGRGNGFSETGSAAVRFDRQFEQVVIGGRDGFPGGPATLHAFDPGLGPIVRYNSFDIAEYDSVAPSPVCGFFAAGRTGAIGTTADIFYAKTNDAIMTTCNLRVSFQRRDRDPVPFDLPIREIEAPERVELDMERFTPQAGRLVICIDSFCEPCVADWNMDGTIDIFDILAFLGAWNAMLPSADLNMDGTIDIFDILAFLGQWNGGCV